MSLTWTRRTSSFGSTSIVAVAYNGVDLWTIVGYYGIATSPDGITWTQRESSFGGTGIRAVAHNGMDLWVAGGFSGAIATSPDGITWTQRDSGFGGSNYIAGIAHNGVNLWTIVGYSGKLATSPDGITWTPRTSSFGTTGLRAVAHNGSDLWVAVGYSGKLATSPDGITWTPRTSSFSDVIYGVAHNGTDLWVAVGQQGKLATSPDGITWTQRESGFGTISIYGIAYNGTDLWVAVGNSGKLATSPDGITWTQETSGFDSEDIRAVAHDGMDMWVAVGYEGGLTTGQYPLAEGPLDIDDYKVIEWRVSKGMDDPFWVLKAEIDKQVVPAFFEKTRVKALDHQNIPQTVFVGLIPAIDYQLKTAENKAEVVGYDYAWYLSVQHLPSSMEIIDIDQNPSRTIANILGGTNWKKETGIEPYRINTVAAWDDPDNPIKKQFTFQEKTLKWNAIVEIADYCNFVFVVKWKEIDGDWRPCAYFVHENDVDTGGIGLDLPPEMTITAPDKYLINDVAIKDEPIYRYNRVLCVGFNQETSEYFYSTAQTAGVADGSEIPREYTYTEAALNTKAKTEEKAQELLDLFQESWTIYTAKFKNRMDLELYQTLSLGGYQEIDSDEMRITAIKYTRDAADDVVEIEFSKNQPIQQIKRLQRAMKTRIHYETFISDMWEESGAYAQLIEDRPINFQGWGAYNITTIYGPKGSDMGLWGWDTTNERGREYLRWRNHLTGYAIDRGIEIKENLIINNDPTGTDNIKYPKIYFGIEPGKETYIRAIKNETMYGLDMVAGGQARGSMLGLVNPVNEEEDPYLLLKRKVYATTDLIVAGTIQAWQAEGESITDLTFYDNRAGTKTLSDLSSAGLWLSGYSEELGDFALLKIPKNIDLAKESIKRCYQVQGRDDMDLYIQADVNRNLRLRARGEAGQSYDLLELGYHSADSPLAVIAHTDLIPGSNSTRKCGTNTRKWFETWSSLVYGGEIIAWNRIEGYGNQNLKFWDKETGEVTLKQLAAGGEGGEAGPHTHSASDITSGLLAMARGGTGNDYGDAESVDGYSIVKLTGSPASFPAGTCRSYSWYVDHTKAVVASPDLSYESSPDCGGIVCYVTKQEESNDEIRITVYNGSSTTQYIGVRAIVLTY